MGELMADNNTKQKILDISLSLFSQYGYNSVSIRDICREVGIKESTVYYYFKNKRSIFEEHEQKFEYLANNMMARLRQAVKGGFIINDKGSDTIQAFQSVSDIFFEQYLMEPFCNSFLRIISIEHHSDAKMQILYHKWIFDEPILFQSEIFDMLTKHMVENKPDSRYLAIQYYSPILFYFQYYLLSGNLCDETKSAFRNNVDYHLSCFIKSGGLNL